MAVESEPFLRVLLHTIGFVTVKHLIKKNALTTFHRISTSQYNHIKNIGLISHPSHASRHKQRPRVKLWATTTSKGKKPGIVYRRKAVLPHAAINQLTITISQSLLKNTTFFTPSDQKRDLSSDIESQIALKRRLRSHWQQTRDLLAKIALNH
ncbi:Reverse transcriptase domain-containing protein [Aphis craccivora]|uniref:Reverse transcriptase domain-containing protein n=1 Tax=Aphis craccivora TaxID=307492 RepID=A0A6G0ZKC7_APHCR|nr:Reverse transcriptase domain-containing protein [Aphis craccivora]